VSGLPGDQAAAESVLERRYRRLLAWYPASYRAANQEEMLAVALARAQLGQRWPGLGESASLVRGGLRARAHALMRVQRTDPWGDVLALAGLAGAVLLATVYAEAAVGVPASRLADQPERPAVSLIALAAGWCLVAGAVMARWRRAAAAGAVLGAVAETAHLALQSQFVPAPFAAWWQLAVAAATALAAISLPARPRAELPVLRWPVLAVIVLTAVALVLFPLLQAATTVVGFYPGGAGVRTMLNPLGVAEELVQGFLVILLGVTLLAAVARPLWVLRRRAG
jgi:hypothetical protein